MRHELNYVVNGIINRTPCRRGLSNRMHVAEKFERLLETYRHPDGRKWNGAELAEATGGVVHRSYATNLRKGRIESPGYDKMRAIAKVMGFSPVLWFEDHLGHGVKVEPAGDNLASRLEYLFQAVRNPTTGELYSDGEIARMSAGDLSEEDVEGIRTGRAADPSVGQVVALAAAFGVEPSYLLDRGKDPSVLDSELVTALKDETVRAITRVSSRLPVREREMTLGIVSQFEDGRSDERDRKRR